MWSASSRTVMTTRSMPSGAALHEVDQPARSGDHQVDPAAQRLDLAAHRRAAVDGGEPDSDGVAERSEHVSDLLGELTGRHEDQAARGPLGALPHRLGEASQHGKAEAEGLSRTGLGAAEDISTGQRVRKGAGLDREGRDHAAAVQRGDERCGQAQLGEREVGRGRRSRKCCRQARDRAADGARWRTAGAAARPEVRRRGEPLLPLVLRLYEEEGLEWLWDTAARGRRTCSGKEELHQRSSAATCFARRGTRKARKASSESLENQRPRGPLARGSGETTGPATYKATSRPAAPVAYHHAACSQQPQQPRAHAYPRPVALNGMTYPTPHIQPATRPPAPLLLGGLMTAWLGAWLGGRAASDDLLTGAQRGDAPHTVRGIPDEPGSVPLSRVLPLLRRVAPADVSLRLPVPGDPDGLSGVMLARALRCGEAVAVQPAAADDPHAHGWLLIPETDVRGSSLEPLVTVEWELMPIAGPSQRQPGERRHPAAGSGARAVRERERQPPRSSPRSARSGGSARRSSRPSRRLRKRSGLKLPLPPGSPPDAIRVLTTAQRLEAVVELAAGEQPLSAAADARRMDSTCARFREPCATLSGWPSPACAAGEAGASSARQPRRKAAGRDRTPALDRHT